MLVQGRTVDRAGFGAGTGWELKPEGACRGEVCVPLGGADDGGLDGDLVDVDAVAGRLGMPVVTDEASGWRAIGPATLSGRALETAEASEVELPLVMGDGTWRLSQQRGRRTVMVAWAPW